MRIVQNKITDYLSINVTETETAWSSGSLYYYADEVRQGHFIYKYAGENQTNTKDDPEVTYDRDKETYSVWVRVRPTNYWAALDEKTFTRTVKADSLVIELTNNDYDTVALLNLNATDVTIELIDLTTTDVLYTSSYDLNNTIDIVDEKSFWYNQFDYSTIVYEQNVPLLTNTKLKITINYTGDAVGVGRLIAGSSTYIGTTLYPATLDQITYSRFNTDIFGNTDLQQGQTTKQQSYTVIAPNSRIPFLERKRKELTAIPLLFVMDDSETSNLDNLLVYGYFTSAPFSISNGSATNISVNIKGLI